MTATFSPDLPEPGSREYKIERLRTLALMESGREYHTVESFFEVIRLADILCIFNATVIVGDLPADMQLGMIQYAYGQIAGMWKLKDDNLLHQSDACIDFIWSKIPQNA